MAIKPTKANILVKVPFEENETDGGIIIPDNAGVSSLVKAYVVALGPNASKDIYINDIVFFYRKNGEKMILDEKEHYLVNSGDIEMISNSEGTGDINS